MRALSVNGETKELQEIDIQMQANTVYTFFNSIAIDEFGIINNHIIYSNSDALSKNETPFFIADQLIIGSALIVGQEDLVDNDATIPMSDLEALINYEVNDFYKSALALFAISDINLYSTFELVHKDKNVQLNTEWVLYTFNIADDKTKEYFLDELKKVANEKVKTEEFIYKMAGLALNAAG